MKDYYRKYFLIQSITDFSSNSKTRLENRGDGEGTLPTKTRLENRGDVEGALPTNVSGLLD